MLLCGPCVARKPGGEDPRRKLARALVYIVCACSPCWMFAACAKAAGGLCGRERSWLKASTLSAGRPLGLLDCRTIWSVFVYAFQRSSRTGKGQRGQTTDERRSSEQPFGPKFELASKGYLHLSHRAPGAWGSCALHESGGARSSQPRKSFFVLALLGRCIQKSFSWFVWRVCVGRKLLKS